MGIKYTLDDRLDAIATDNGANVLAAVEDLLENGTCEEHVLVIPSNCQLKIILIKQSLKIIVEFWTRSELGLQFITIKIDTACTYWYIEGAWSGLTGQGLDLTGQARLADLWQPCPPPVSAAYLCNHSNVQIWATKIDKIQIEKRSIDAQCTNSCVCCVGCTLIHSPPLRRVSCVLYCSN